MSKASEAATQIRNAAKMFKGFSDAAAILENIGSLDNATEESKARIEAARKEESELNEQMKAVKQSVDDMKKNGIILVQKANDDAAEITSNANVNADTILNGARTESSRLISEAEEKAHAALDAVKEDVDNLVVRKDELNQSISDCEQREKEASDKADIAEERLAGIKESIAALAAS